MNMAQQKVPEVLQTVFSLVDQKKTELIDLLREAVAIKSVSGWPEARNEVVRMINWMKEKLEKEGATCELKELGEQTLADGTKLKLPPVMLGHLGSDPAKKTLLVYGHLDVQPALLADAHKPAPKERTPDRRYEPDSGDPTVREHCRGYEQDYFFRRGSNRLPRFGCVGGALQT